MISDQCFFFATVLADFGEYDRRSHLLEAVLRVGCQNRNLVGGALGLTGQAQ